MNNIIGYSTTVGDSANPYPEFAPYTVPVGWQPSKFPQGVKYNPWKEYEVVDKPDLYDQLIMVKENFVGNNIDNELMCKLTAMRDTRDAAARYAQSKNDEAQLHEIEAVRLRAQALMMYGEINEGVPMTPDAK